MRRTSRCGSSNSRQNGAHGEDQDYREWLKRQPCVVCGRTPCDPAHVGLRGLGIKCPDREAISLCPGHHRRDGWPDSQHRLGKRFWVYHGLNREKIIAELNRRYEKEMSNEGPDNWKNAN